MDARRADERRDPAGLARRDLLDHRVRVDRLLGQPERAARDRWDQGDLVSVGERGLAAGVLLVHGVEEALGLVAEAELRPDVGDRRGVELARRPARALAQPCEKPDRHGHASTVRWQWMGMFFHSADEAPERPADPALRRANLRRVGRLFAPYWRRLSGLLALIVVSAGLGVIPAFLLKRALEAIQRNDTRSLSINAGAMIAIAIVTGALGVVQTLLSNQTGQRVMHDLRASVFRHLQRLSLAFFTRTRTGEVQSRIQNDIGGVQNVVTNTATSIASNVTTVAATVVGMLVLNWKLALFALALIPIFAVLTRRVGQERRRIAKTTQETLADISSQVQESLSVSGIMLGKTMGRGAELANRFETESLRLAELEVRQRMAGRWVMASIQTSFAIMPAAVYWFGGLLLAHGSPAVSVPMLVAFTTLQTRLFFPVGSLLGVGLDVQTSLALFDRIFEYLDQPVDIVEKPGALEQSSRATSSSTTSGSGTASRTGRSRTSPSRSTRARRLRSSARPAPARRRSRI